MGEVRPMHRIFVHPQELEPNLVVFQLNVLNHEDTLVRGQPQPNGLDVGSMIRRDGREGVKLSYHVLHQGTERSNQEMVTGTTDRFEFVKVQHQVLSDWDPIGDAPLHGTSSMIHRV